MKENIRQTYLMEVPEKYVQLKYSWSTTYKNNCYLYCLVDPRDNCVFYIGKSINPNTRYHTHLSDKKPSERRKKVDEIISSGYKPIMEILLHSNEETIEKMEQELTEKFYDRLTNIYAGSKQVESVRKQNHNKKMTQLNNGLIFLFREGYHFVVGGKSIRNMKQVHRLSDIWHMKFEGFSKVWLYNKLYSVGINNGILHRHKHMTAQEITKSTIYVDGKYYKIKLKKVIDYDK